MPDSSKGRAGHNDEECRMRRIEQVRQINVSLLITRFIRRHLLDSSHATQPLSLMVAQRTMLIAPSFLISYFLLAGGDEHHRAGDQRAADQRRTRGWLIQHQHTQEGHEEWLGGGDDGRSHRT